MSISYIKQNNFLRALIELGMVSLIILIIFILARFIMLKYLVLDAYQSLVDHEKDLYWKYSFLFDLKTITIILIPGALACIFPFSRTYGFLQKFTRYYYPCAISCAFLAAACNYYYFKTYGHPFDVMILGVVNEDFKAVMISIWDGYPVIWMLIALVLVAFGANKLIEFYRTKLATRIANKRRPKYLIAGSFLAFLILWPILVRGGVDTFPLRRTEVAVTTETKVNGTVANGLISFIWTVTHLNFFKTMKPINLDHLEREVSYFNLPFNRDDPIASLKQTTKANEFLAKHKPHVAFALMESMSTDMLGYDDPKNFDVYASLRDVLARPNTYWFKHVISEGDGTIDSLQRILVNTGYYLDLSVSMYGRKHFATSVVTPFKKAGYKTYFISAGLSTWRNLGDFALAQGFDEFIDQNKIIELIPKATAATWGVYDEYMFQAVEKILKEAKEPTFIFMLSVTNHPPYKIPDHAKHMNRDYKIVEQAYHNSDIYDMYDTFHYANDQLGKFVLKVMDQPELSNNTIVAFSGDHNVRGLNVYNKINDQIRGHQVPFFVYIPSSIKESLTDFQFDPKRFASHKDLMTTLFNLSLSNIDYYNTGCNLFAPSKECHFNFAFNGNITVDQNGLCISEDQFYIKRRAYKLNADLFEGINESDDRLTVCKTAKYFNDLLDSYKRFQTVGAK